MTTAQGTDWAAVSVKHHQHKMLAVITVNAKFDQKSTTRARFLFGSKAKASQDDLFLSGVEMVSGMDGVADLPAIRVVGPGAAEFFAAHNGLVPGSSTVKLSMLTSSSHRNTMKKFLSGEQRKAAFNPHMVFFVNPAGWESSRQRRESGPVESSSMTQEEARKLWTAPERWAAISSKRCPDLGYYIVSAHIHEAGRTDNRQTFITLTDDSMVERLGLFDKGVSLVGEMFGAVENMTIFCAGADANIYATTFARKHDDAGVMIRKLTPAIYEDLGLPELSVAPLRELLRPATSVYVMNAPAPEKTAVKAAPVKIAPVKTAPAAKETQVVKAVKKVKAAPALDPLAAPVWGAVGVKYDQSRRCYVVQVHHQNDTDGTGRTETLNVDQDKADSSLESVYLKGVASLFAMDPQLKFTSVHFTGVDVDDVLAKMGAKLDGTHVTFHKLNLRFFQKKIVPAVADKSIQDAFYPGTVLHGNPSTLAGRHNFLHVHTDASQIYGKSADNGYGHGVAIDNINTNTVEVHSTWNTTRRVYTPNQFELDGIFVAAARCVENYGPSGSSDDHLAVLLYCDNKEAVRIFNDVVSAPSALARQIILDSKDMGRGYVPDLSWMDAHNILVEAQWVKGHSVNKLNNTVDALSVNARKFHYGEMDHEIYEATVELHAHHIGAVVGSIEPDLAALRAQLNIA